MIEFTKGKGKNLDIKQNGESIKFKIEKSNLPQGIVVTEYSTDYKNKNLLIDLENTDNFDQLKNLEKEIIKELSNKSPEIFKKFVNEDEIFDIFNSNLSYDGMLRLKFTPDTILYNESGTALAEKVIYDGIFTNWDVICNYMVTGVYFFDKKIGLILKAHHVKLFKPENKNQCLFSSDSDSGSD
tara:strand:+ start:32 stop:583 length:552 start_codon:yes stop_codon:yes gene_type:complete